MLHETTQRRVCRVAFLAVCMLPTMAVATGVVWRICPAWRHEVLQHASTQLGARLQAERIVTPQLGRWRLENLSLHDAETNTELAAIDWLEACDHKIHGGEVRVNRDNLVAAGQWLHQLLLQDQDQISIVTFDRLYLTAEQPPLQHVAARRSSRDKNSAATGASFEIIAGRGNEALRLSLVRNRQKLPPSTQLTLSTGDGTIKWQTIAHLLPGAPQLGEQATFHGELSTVFRGESTTGQLVGEIDQLQADSLFGDELQLAQLIKLTVTDWRWQAGRLTNLAASVDGESGTISRSLLRDLCEQVHCGASQRLLDQWGIHPDQPIAFDRITCDVAIDASGLTLTGDPTTGALLRWSDNALLFQPAYRQLPLSSLVRLFTPATADTLPASAEAQSMASRLPLPSAAASQQR